MCFRWFPLSLWRRSSGVLSAPLRRMSLWNTEQTSPPRSLGVVSLWGTAILKSLLRMRYICRLLWGWLIMFVYGQSAYLKYAHYVLYLHCLHLGLASHWYGILPCNVTAADDSLFRKILIPPLTKLTELKPKICLSVSFWGKLSGYKVIYHHNLQRLICLCYRMKICPTTIPH